MAAIPKPKDDKAYFIHSVANDKLVVDAALAHGSKAIVTWEKNGQKNQKESGFDTSSCSVS